MTKSHIITGRRTTSQYFVTSFELEGKIVRPEHDRHVAFIVLSLNAM